MPAELASRSQIAMPTIDGMDAKDSFDRLLQIAKLYYKSLNFT